MYGYIIIFPKFKALFFFTCILAFSLLDRLQYLEIVYLGGNKKPFQEDLEKQTLDISVLVKNGNLCYAGDLNVAFSGYPLSPKIINDVYKRFEDLDLKIVTKNCKDSAIHAVISNSFLNHLNYSKEELFFYKKITDHRLVTITINAKNENLS